jgi:hypothetical protein
MKGTEYTHVYHLNDHEVLKGGSKPNTEVLGYSCLYYLKYLRGQINANPNLIFPQKQV